jgi:hypothetical protein
MPQNAATLLRTATGFRLMSEKRLKFCEPVRQTHSTSRLNILCRWKGSVPNG